MPGHLDNPADPAATLYAYAIAAANENGAGTKSATANTDPANGRNWWPAGKERVFQRQTALLFPPYVTPPVHYPGTPAPAAP